ncbi:MAG: hypothetical protein VYD05_03695, partial [Planctomycetota bacterium]|nr:hypothetical protein [Planctomycetota bacterium]
VSEGATEGERAALVDGTKSIRRGLSKLMQSVDATRLRGKKVRFRASVRTAELSAGDRVQLFCRVDRPRDENGKTQLGAFDDMQDRPIRVSEWQRFEIVLDVASDATEVVLGLKVLGKGRVWIDDARLSVVAASAEAGAAGAAGSSVAPPAAAVPPRAAAPPKSTETAAPTPKPKQDPTPTPKPAPTPTPKQDPGPEPASEQKPPAPAVKRAAAAKTQTPTPARRAVVRPGTFWTPWLLAPALAVAMFFLGLWPLRPRAPAVAPQSPYDLVAAYRDDGGMGWLRFFALRFTIAYWALSCLPRLLSDILWWLGDALDQGAREGGMSFLEGWSEPITWLGGRIASGAATCEAWLAELSGEWMLGTTTIAAPSGDGSDTLLGYLTAFNFVVCAAVLGAGWTFFKRRYPCRNASVDLLWSLLRDALAFGLLTWAHEILTNAMSAGSFMEGRLDATVGQQSPDEPMWGFMATSRPYLVFLGVGELVAAFSLLWRRTMLFGAVLAVVWMANALLLSCCFDMPYKLKASHHLMMGLAVLIPDARRVGGLLLLNQNPVTDATANVWHMTRAGWLRWVPKTIIVAACFLLPIGRWIWRLTTT